MENNKKIGKLFKERLNYLDATPREGGWNAIQTELDKKKKKRRFFIPFWFRTASLFLTGIVISAYIYDTNSNFRNFNLFDKKIEIKTTDSENLKNNKLQNYKQELVTIDSTNQKNDDDILSEKSTENNKFIKSEITKKLESEKINKSKNSESKNSSNYSNNFKVSTKSNLKKTTFSKNKFERKKSITEANNKKQDSSSTNISDENIIYNQNSISKNTIQTTIENSSEKSFQSNLTEKVEIKKTDSISNKKLKKELVKLEEKDSLKIEEIKKEKFTLFAFASPTLSVFNSKTSLLDSRLDNNSKNAEIGLSYGAYLCFEGTERFSLRIGIAKSNLKFITKNALINTSNYSEINYATGFSNTFIYSQSNNSQLTNIKQEITYIEVPLEAKYKIIDKKISINGIIGFSYLFLDKNEVYFETSNGAKYNVGSTRDLLKQTIGVNLGIGLDYKITKKLKLNIEPILKYNLKNSQNSNYSNPLSTTIFTGLEYCFGK